MARKALEKGIIELATLFFLFCQGQQWQLTQKGQKQNVHFKYHLKSISFKLTLTTILNNILDQKV